MTLNQAVLRRAVGSALLVGVSTLAPAVDAALVNDLNNPYHIDTALQYQNQILWMSAVDPTDGRVLHASAIRINERFAISSAHQFFENGIAFTDHTLGNGTNFLTNPGETRRVANVIIHPGYTGLESNIGRHPDIAIIEFDSAWAGPTAVIPDSLAVNTEIIHVGFGRPGDVANGIFDQDGYARAFTTHVDEFGIGGSTQDYADLEFRAQIFDPRARATDGVSTGGDSGGAGFGLNGELYTLTSGSFIASGNDFGGTIALDLTQYRDDFILPNTQVPEPGSLALLALGGALTLRRRRG